LILSRRDRAERSASSLATCTRWPWICEENNQIQCSHTIRYSALMLVEAVRWQGSWLLFHGQVECDAQMPLMCARCSGAYYHAKGCMQAGLPHQRRLTGRLAHTTQRPALSPHLPLRTYMQASFPPQSAWQLALH
jgi:hypothetical protein